MSQKKYLSEVSILKKVIHAGRSQGLGMAAQVIAAIPPMLVAIYLARIEGLPAVADFAMLFAASSLALSVGTTGLRAQLLIDRFEAFAKPDYLRLRIASSATMAGAIVVAGLVIGADPMLVLAVMLLRIGDAALDLVLGFDQVTIESDGQLYGFTIGSTAKLILVSIALLAADLWSGVGTYPAFALASLLYAVLAWRTMTRRSRDLEILDGRTPRTFLLAKVSMSFCVAQVICALLTTYPRLALKLVQDQNLAGAAAASLSVATLLGMAYYAVWLRWGPKLGRSGTWSVGSIYFILELLVVFIVSEITMYLLGPFLMAQVFAIEEPALLAVSVQTLLCASLFFLAMNITNLFKFTTAPWLESGTYTAAIAVMLVYSLVLGGRNIPQLLIIGALVMLAMQAMVLSVPAMLKLKRQ